MEANSSSSCSSQKHDGGLGNSSQNTGDEVLPVSEIKLNWKRIVGPFPGRDGHCACVCSDLMYVFGGVVQTSTEDYEESNELIHFNPVTQEWGKIPPSASDPLPRSAATMTCVGSKLYLFGGLNGEMGWLDDLHVFDTVTKKWSSVIVSGKGPSPRDKTASATIGENIYIFGGFGPQTTRHSVEEEDDSTNEGLEEYQSTQEAAQFGWFDDLFVLNTATNAWSQPMQMNRAGPTPRAAHTLSPVGSQLVVFAGRDCEARQNDLYVYDTATRLWLKDFTASGSPPACRSFHASAVAGSRVFVVAGRGASDQHFNDVHVLDLDSKHWCGPVMGGDSLTHRGVHVATIVGRHLVVYAGSSEFNRNIQQCTKYHSDAYIADIGDLLKKKEESTNGSH